MTNKLNDGSKDISHLPPKKDAFLAMPIIVVVVLFFLQLGLISDDHLLMFSIFIVSAMSVMAVVFLYRGVNHIVHRRYKSAASMILAIPILVLVLGFPGVSEWGRCARNVTYYIRFVLHENQYVDEVKLIQPDSKGFRYAKFIWNGSYGDGNETVLVYDESDGLNLPQHRGYGSDCPYLVYKLKSHFYVVRVLCG